MAEPGMWVPQVRTGGQRKRGAAVALATLTLLQVLLPALLLVSLAPTASASIITTDESGRSSFDMGLDGVPQRFNLSLSAEAVVTSFQLGLATASGAAPPNVPSAVTVDLGADGPDWAFGGGGEGNVGWQRSFERGDSHLSCPVGPVACAMPFALPKDARVESFSFDVRPRANMTLWGTPDYVSELSGVAAVPLNLSWNSAATVADLDLDGTTDLIATGSQGTVRVYARFGTTGWVFNETVGAVDPALRQGRQFAHPQVADLTGDGTPDIVVGTGQGDVTLLERQDVTQGPPFVFAENTSFFGGVRVAGNATPALGDLDGDGDLDLVVGSYTGELFHYRNDMGLPPGINWQVLNTFSAANVSVGGDAAPALVDIEGDGDLDLAVGDAAGAIVLFENHGGPSGPRFEFVGALSGARAAGKATPAFTDLDADGTPDLLFGSRGGLVFHAAALGGLPANVTVAVSGVAAPIRLNVGPLNSPVQVVLDAAKRTEFSGAALPLDVDSWGNALEAGHISFESSHFGDITVANLSIHYGATFVLPDLAAEYRAFAATAVPQGNQIVVPIVVTGSPAAGGSSARVHIPAVRVVVDDVPQFLPAPFLALDEDTANPYLFDLRAIAADEDASSVTYEVASYSNETFADVTITDGVYLGVDVASGDLNDNWTGVIDVVVRAVDRLGQEANSPPIRVVVRGVGDAPVIENIPLQYLAPNESLRLTVRAIDGDPGDQVAFTALSPTPTTATINAETGALYWSPTSAERAVGTAHFFIYASDGELGDVQAFQVIMIPSTEPVFGRPLPAVEVLPGRPEFLNIFDFATGNVEDVISVTMEPREFVNLSADGRWLVFDYPASSVGAGTDRVDVDIETVRGTETAAVDIEIMTRPAGVHIAPFPPTPIGRGVTHRIELLRYTYQVVDFPNLSFSVDHPLASVNGYNLTLLAPAEYPGHSLSVTVHAKAGDEEATAVWRINLQPAGELPRLARLPMISAAVRTVDLSWALAQRGIGPSSWPLTTDSERFAVSGTSVFGAHYPEWPLADAARDFWPIDRARVLAANGQAVLEVETGFDGRSRYVDRVQYFAEDEWAFVDATFTSQPDLAGSRVHNISVIGTGPFMAGPLEASERPSGGQGTGWRVTFSRDTLLQQLSIVGLAEGGAGSDTAVAWPIWAVVIPRDDPPVYTGGAGSLVVQVGQTLTVDLSEHFEDEEGDDLLYQLTQAGPGVQLDRSTGWLQLDGAQALNLTGVRVIASEARNQSLFAESGPFTIGLNVTAAEQPPPAPSMWGFLSDTVTQVLILLAGLVASTGLAVYLGTRRRAAREAQAEAAWDELVRQRPPPAEPPVEGEPAMVALEEEWARVVASRHADGATPAEDTEADLEAGVKSRAHPSPAVAPAPEEAPKRAQMSSSDTETERRAGETESEGPGSPRRARRR